VDPPTRRGVEEETKIEKREKRRDITMERDANGEERRRDKMDGL